MGKYLKGNLQIQLALGSLAAADLVKQDAGDTLTEKHWLSSVKQSYTLSNFTPVVNDGPVGVGIAHSDYSDTEIEEWYEQSQSWSTADLIAQERGKRKIRFVGYFEVAASADPSENMVLNDGKPIHTKCGWMLDSGQTISLWAFNEGSSSLTTGAVVNTKGHANLWAR